MPEMSTVLINAASFLIGLVMMEGVAFAMHRWIMHGPLWVWHKSHHTPDARGFELNDLFAFVFAGISIGLFWLGGQPGLDFLWWLAAGTTAYGLLYALVHDGLVHRRIPFPFKGERGYLLRLKRAHHMHHVVHTREGAVSFGFLFAQDPERLARQLSQARRMEKAGALKEGEAVEGRAGR